MMKAVSAVLAVILVTSVLAPAVAQAQEDSNSTATTNTPAETPTATPTPSPSPTETEETRSEQDSDLNVTADDLWTVFKTSEKAGKPAETRIIRQLGPNLYVTDIAWSSTEDDLPDGTVEVTFRSEFTTQITVTDSTGVFAGDNKGEKRSITIPRGTFTVPFPATPADEDAEYQAISVDPGGGYVYGLESKDERGTGNPFDRLINLQLALAGIGLFLLGIIIRVGYKVYRKQETGAPETLDGVKIESDRVGVEDDE